MVKYKSMAAATRSIRKIIKNATIDKAFKNEELLTLLTHHPDKRVKNMEDVEYVCVRWDKQWRSNRSLYLKVRGKDEDRISWKHCIRNQFGKFKNDGRKKALVKSALREEIQRGTRRDYFLKSDYEKIGRSWFVTCENCGKKRIANSDHSEVPFKKISHDFLEMENLSMIDIEVFEDAKDHGKLRLKNRELAERWKKYHDSKAIWKILCTQCNNKEGTYGF